MIGLLGVHAPDLVEQESNLGPEDATILRRLYRNYPVLFSSYLCSRPSHGGKYCSGESEDWQICIVQECTDSLLDLRSQQCKLLPRLLNLEIAEQNATWTPHESDLSKYFFI